MYDCDMHCCITAFENASIKALFRQNAEIKEELRDIKSLLHEVLRRQKSSDSVRSGKLPEGIVIPLTSVNDVRIIEDRLRSNDTYSQLVSTCTS